MRKSKNKREGPSDSVREREGSWMTRESDTERGGARKSENEREVPREVRGSERAV